VAAGMALGALQGWCNLSLSGCNIYHCMDFVLGVDRAEYIS
jgi:hypothetical protein